MVTRANPGIANKIISELRQQYNVEDHFLIVEILPDEQDPHGKRVVIHNADFTIEWWGSHWVYSKGSAFYDLETFTAVLSELEYRASQSGRELWIINRTNEENPNA